MRATAAYLEQLMRDYQTEYARANGKTAPDLVWERGWFRFSSWPGRYRRAEVEEMLACLRERPAYAHSRPPREAPHE